MSVAIIGAGLAGSECAWQLAKRGVQSVIFEMRPHKMTEAHKTDKFAELVCSNSFRGADLSNAVGLLKEELRVIDSLIMRSADHAAVPAGGALAVDREIFSSHVTEQISQTELIEITTREVKSLSELSDFEIIIVATGPLTASSLATELAELTGEENLAFYDAISPIITYDSLDHSVIFEQSRYDKGTGKDYLNIPLSEQEYKDFVENILESEKYQSHLEADANIRPFEGCMPIEDIAERGFETLRFGPLKPKGLTDPKTGKTPYAVIQLRRDNREGTLWSFVGMQTRMKQGEQKRIIQSLPGLAGAEFVRFGTVHRNTFINSPKCLDKNLRLKKDTKIMFAGQITGVEGYVESCACGAVAGTYASYILAGQEAPPFPSNTAIGSLVNYVTDPEREQFQPMNISFGLMPAYFENSGKKVPKKERRLKTAENALASLNEFNISSHRKRA